MKSIGRGKHAIITSTTRSNYVPFNSPRNYRRFVDFLLFDFSYVLTTGHRNSRGCSGKGVPGNIRWLTRRNISSLLPYCPCNCTIRAVSIVAVVRTVPLVGAIPASVILLRDRRNEIYLSFRRGQLKTVLFPAVNFSTKNGDITP